MNTAILKHCGIDYEKGLARCMDDEEFYEEFLAMFLRDDCFERAKAAYEAKDNAALFKCMHELKGACGNAAMTELYDAVCPLVELLRRGEDAPESIAAQFSIMEAAYLRTREGLVQALEG